MKNIAFVLAAAAALIAVLDVNALAGWRQGSGQSVVQIGRMSNGRGVMKGVPAFVHGSSSPAEYILCNFRQVLDGARTAYCKAKTADGDTAECRTDDPALIDTIAVLQPGDAWTIEWDQTGECLGVSATRGSPYGPF
jgi:hypothetical protein